MSAPAYLGLSGSGWGLSALDLSRLMHPLHHLMQNGSLPLSLTAIAALREYSASLPTGTGEGKVWRRRAGSGWFLGRYGASYPDGHRYEGQVPISWYRIYVEGQAAAFPDEVRVPRPVMRGRMVQHRAAA